MSKCALITGINGQDGWYLARLLLRKGYDVTGTTHRSEAAGVLAVEGREVPVVSLNLTKMLEVEDLLESHQFDEVYNLAARASSAQLFDDVEASADVNGLAVGRMLEAIRRNSPSTKFCQASTSEVFAGAPQSVQDESTPRTPRNAYGASKAFADHLVAAYRATYDLYACSAILFSHESPRRPPHFLVRKVSRAAALAARDPSHQTVLENLDSKRDWGYADDYMEAMSRMLQPDEPSEYVVASGEAHSVAEVCEIAFRHLNLDWRQHIRVSESSVRAPEPNARVGDASRARSDLAWSPTLGFEDLVRLMVDTDVSLIAQTSISSADHALAD